MTRSNNYNNHTPDTEGLIMTIQTHQPYGTELLTDQVSGSWSAGDTAAPSLPAAEHANQFEASDTFMDHLFAGNTGAAYAMLSPALRAQGTVAVFAAAVATFGLGRPCTVRWTSAAAGPLKSTGQDARMHEGTVTCSHGTKTATLLWVVTGERFELVSFAVE